MGLFRKLFSRIVSDRAVDPIKHVVVLMFENHSFDQMLGCFKTMYPQLEGIDPTNLRINRDLEGREYRQSASNDSVVSPDPMHEVEHVLKQLANGNSGFVTEYQREYQVTSPTTIEQRQKIMNYFDHGDLPVLHELASNFAICDHWYSSVPGPTWTNRFFVHSGTSKGLVEMPSSVTQTSLYLYYDQATIFDRLNEKIIPWRVYYGDVPQSLVLSHQRTPRNAWHYYSLRRFHSDCQGSERTFPAYTFIEPNYFKGEQNDDHPPHSTIRAQRLLANVYNALRSNEELWNSTLLVVLYDEHGGFYDHVEPPTAIVPDQFQQQYSFDRLGIRVPALLVSPWVDAGVITTEFDHTSLLKYLTDKWNLGPLTKRVSHANSFASALRTGKPRHDTPTNIPVPGMAMMMGGELPEGAAEDVTPDEMAEPINDYQRSLIAFTEHLEQEEMDPGVRASSKIMWAGPLSEEQQAKQRVEVFLKQQQAKAAQRP